MPPGEGEETSDNLGVFERSLTAIISENLCFCQIEQMASANEEMADPEVVALAGIKRRKRSIALLAECPIGITAEPAGILVNQLYLD